MTFDEKKDAFIEFAQNEFGVHEVELEFNYVKNEFYFFSVDEQFKAFLAGQASAIPDGYVLVPVEPTQDILEAKDRGGYTMLTDGEYYFPKIENAHAFGTELYKAMIAAAQK